ncbi:hypothetical protein BT63DRAFT_370096 [Microthyrium microscopicum]|uniref:DUF1640-domain-containing protein n=1 Tax=Microthyrium microscopicum TaxID=703497 RepID=A0A6A6UMR2_9PEZI|nr:hypothetical protein BT63DRAFT_370096 [Microthyrium microscopicum]
MESPNAPEDEKPPHLQAPPYVHHFDTWSLVRDLQSGGFSGDQTVTIMKGVRSILADNMNLATRALVSKSNVENELYLFRAACSELKAEIQNARKAEADRWRSQRAQLQHEVDILGQTLTQEAGSMKDELKGLFDDRKMLTRGEQKKVEAKIQELNYKITVALNSDARSNIESLRWILTRRAILALVIAGGMVIGTLNYSRYMTGVQEAERKKHTADMAAVEHDSVAVQKGSIHGLAEEMLLAPEGVSNG